jgi:hypothetical protein
MDFVSASANVGMSRVAASNVFIFMEFIDEVNLFGGTLSASVCSSNCTKQKLEAPMAARAFE